MTTWTCRHTIVLTSGGLNLEAESNLTKRQLRRHANGYIYSTLVEAADDTAALAIARDELAGLLGPYNVTYDIIKSSAVRLGGS